MKRIVWGLIVLIIGITVISVINNREEREDFLDEELSIVININLIIFLLCSRLYPIS